MVRHRPPRSGQASRTTARSPRARPAPLTAGPAPRIKTRPTLMPLPSRELAPWLPIVVLTLRVRSPHAEREDYGVRRSPHAEREAYGNAGDPGRGGERPRAWRWRW